LRESDKGSVSDSYQRSSTVNFPRAFENCFETKNVTSFFQLYKDKEDELSKNGSFIPKSRKKSVLESVYAAAQLAKKLK